MTPSPFILDVADLLGRDAPPRRAHVAAPVDWSLELSTIRPDPPLEADVTLTHLPNGILARGTLRYSVEHTCRRCLTPYTDEADQSFAGLFERDPDEESYPIEGTEIDVEPFFRDEVLLALPMLPECPDGCAVEALDGGADSAEIDEGEWRLEDSPRAEDIRRMLMSAVEDDETA
jgi:uncharacterized metal-binding protein YceD (DUF177 family)